MGNPSFVLVVGMHRSGTSCLAGALEACGLWLGEVGRGDKWNAKGSREHDPARQLNDRILEDAGGSWSAPPGAIAITPAQRAAMADIARELSTRAPAGLKDPRVALLLDAWRAAIGGTSLVGTYRHPASVAASLARRNQMPAAEAHALWRRYNAPLVAAHRAEPFPIVAFDLTEPERYCAAIAHVAAGLGLASDPARIRAFVSAQLDHARDLDKVIPPECRELWDYLEAARVSAAPLAAAAERASCTHGAADARPARPSLVFISGPTCAGKSHYIGRHLEPGGKVLLPDKGARLAVADGGRFFLHYNLLRPFEKSGAVPGESLGRRWSRLRRRLRARILGPFATDRRLLELLALPADFEARVLVVPKEDLLARIAGRQALEPLRAEQEGYLKWDAIVRAVDLPEVYRAWLRFLRARGIPYRLVDARDEEYRPIADERALAALLAAPGGGP